MAKEILAIEGDENGGARGFAVVAGFYLLLGLLLVVFRNAIGQKLQDYLVQIMKKKKE